MSDGMPKLMIATPAPRGEIRVEMATTLLDLHASGLDFDFVGVDDGRSPSRARNALLASFHARTAFTHLLFLDADIDLPAAGIHRLVGLCRDVVAAAVPAVVPGPSGECRFDLGSAVGEDGPLVQVERAAAAVLLLSRSAVDALVADARDGGRVYDGPPLPASEPRARIHYDVFRAGAEDGVYLDADGHACAALRRLGFAIHVDPAIVVRHHGTVSV
jgi:hypothetical protein